MKALAVTVCEVRYTGLPFYLADIGLLLNTRYQPVSVLCHRYDGCSYPTTAVLKKKVYKTSDAGLFSLSVHISLISTFLLIKSGVVGHLDWRNE